MQIYLMEKDKAEETMAQWKAGHRVQIKEKHKLPTHRDFARTNNNFKTACELAEINPSQRQASKFRQGKGKAWETLRMVG